MLCCNILHLYFADFYILIYLTRVFHKKVCSLFHLLRINFPLQLHQRKYFTSECSILVINQLSLNPKEMIYSYWMSYIPSFMRKPSSTNKYARLIVQIIVPGHTSRTRSQLLKQIVQEQPPESKSHIIWSALS